MFRNLIFSFLCIISAAAQVPEADTTNDRWEVNGSLYFYFIPEDFFILPVLKADNDVLHLEARYNYEDRKTVSAWVGYNFTTGSVIEVKFTPMAGVAAGNTAGLLPGFELDLVYNELEFYTESEYLFDFDKEEPNFFYAWSELTYSPSEFIWFGIAGQRTRVYQTDLDVQTGLLAGAAYKNFELNGYLMNPFNNDLFFILSVSVNL